ncbi:MAG: DUF1206 domain-containing protein [Rhodoglobus sp.]
MTPSAAEYAAREARRMRPLRFLARLGFAVNGLLHAIIGLLAIGVAASGGGEADQSGALGQIAANPGGSIILWTVSVGLAALGLWLIVSAFATPPADRTKRVTHFLVAFGKGLAYLFLAGTAFTFARGGSTSSESDAQSLSATLLATPGGVFLLLLIAALVLGIGVYFVVKGVRRRFTRDINVPAGTRGRLVVALGIWGYVSKGIALFSVGVLLIIAAVSVDPAKASGLDGALRSLVSLPFGQLVLTGIGCGFIAYGVYSLVRARIARL